MPDTTLHAGAALRLDTAALPLICLLRYHFLTDPDALAASPAALRRLFQPDDGAVPAEAAPLIQYFASDAVLG